MEHFMTSEEIAEILHVDPVTIRRLVNKNELSAYRIGADYRFAPSDLQDYLQRQHIPAHAQKETSTNANHPLDPLVQSLRKIFAGKHTTPSELMGRFDKFTERARHVVMLAAEEARHFRHNYIGTEHLLLGLIREGEGVAAEVLSNLGIKSDQIRHAIEAIVGYGDHVVPDEEGSTPFTPRAKRVVELAVDEARRLNHRYIGTEHFLLGLIREGDGIAGGVLKVLGLQLEQVRIETIRVLSQHRIEDEKTPAPTILPIPAEATTLLAEDEAGLTCTFCEARCPGYFRYCFNCGQPLIHEEESSHGEEG
jgi:excisionase family DNA binding protein